eukprot:gene6321-6556_t
MNELLEFVAKHFNAIRLPFSAELALNMDSRKPGNIDYAANPKLKGLTSGQVMDKLVQGCASRGLLVLLDMHRLAAAKDIPELWYDSEHSEDKVLQAWRTIVLRYKDCPNVFAADINNEPHGCASWGDGHAATDWCMAAERLAAVILEANPRLLLFVEGVERNAVVQPPENCWWGGHVAAAKAGGTVAPVKLPVPSKLVYSPHVYGPDVFAQPYFNDPNFPENMPEIWSRHFGFVKQECLGPAVCPGEWGGWARPGSKDETWQNKIANWFRENDITDSFYWCLNPNSGDTGGVLQDDWQTPNQHKLDIIAKAHPAPTQFPQWQVFEVNSWSEGATPCFQTDIKVTNIGTTAARRMRLRVATAGAEMQKYWNAIKLPDDEPGCWMFDLPDWVGPAGLATGASLVTGIITRGAKPGDIQLQSVQLGESIWLHWGVSGDVSSSRTVTFGVTASLPAATSYLGIGLSELGSMKGADVWLLNKTSSGSWELVDAYAPGFVKPVADAHQDLKLLGVESNGNGSLIAAWRRFLAPCDLQDLPIIADTPIHVIWAHHNDGGYHGTSSRGGKVVNFIPAASNVAHLANTSQPLASDVKTLDLVYNVTIPPQETSYFIHYFKLPSDKKYHIVKYEPIGHLPQLHHGVAYSCLPDQNEKVAALPSLGPFDRFHTQMLCEQFYMLLTPNFTNVLPPIVGLPMGTNNSLWVALELHYNNPELVSGIKDERAGIRVYYTDKLRPQDMGLITLNQPVLAIPPGVAHYPANVSVCPSSCTQRFRQPKNLLASFLHMHGVGKSIIVRRYREGRELSPIADLRAFDYPFQGVSPIPPEARVLQPGDMLTLQCTFDSTERTNVTLGGFGTREEMCFAWLEYYPAQDGMGLCYSYGGQPVAICGTDIDVEIKLFKSLDSPNPSEGIQQLVGAGKLLKAEKPGVNVTQYKGACTNDLPAVTQPTDQVVLPSAG